MHAKSEIKEMRKKFEQAQKLSLENHTRENQNQNTQLITNQEKNGSRNRDENLSREDRFS